jgi:hypothetical protein
VRLGRAHVQREASRGRQRQDELGGFADEAAQVRRLQHDVPLPRVEPRKGENAFDQPEQVPAGDRNPRELGALALRKVPRYANVQQVGEAENGVQRGAELVRHRRQESRLRGVRLLRLPPHLFRHLGGP